MANKDYKISLQPVLSSISVDDEKLKKQVNDLRNAINKAINSGDGGIKLKVDLSDVTQQVKKATDEIQKALNRKPVTTKVVADKTEKPVDVEKQNTQLQRQQTIITGLIERLKVMRTSWSDMFSDPKLAGMWADTIGSLKVGLDDVGRGTTQTASQMDLYRRSVTSLSNATKEAGMNQMSFGDLILSTGKRLTAYLASLLSVNTVIRGLRSAVGSVKELDDSLVELRKVTDISGTALNDFTDRAFKLGTTIGRTGKEVIDAVSTFRRAGYDLESSLESLAAASLVMVNVGDNINDVEYASSALIAVLRGFKMSENDAMGIVDKINEVSNTAPIAFADLTEGLRRTSGILAQSGTSLEQSIGILTGGFSQLRDIEGVSAGKIVKNSPYVQKCA